MNDTPPPSYNDLLATDPGTLPPHAALRLLACLIDAATDHNDPNGLRHAISIAPNIQARLTLPTETPTLHYYLGNAWSELQHQRPAANERVWEWNQPECEQAILAYRTAIQADGLRQLQPQEQSCIRTNLANLLNHLGRTIEALHEWDLALQTTPTFGMARGNRALGLKTYAAHLYNDCHKALLLKTAHDELTRALNDDIEPHARNGFTQALDEIKDTLHPEYLASTTTPDDTPHGTTTNEQTYRHRLLRARLFLNPLNDLGPHPNAAQDTLTTPPIIVTPGTGPTHQGAMNQLKQEYIAARYFYDQGTQQRTQPHYADKDVTLTDTLDYPAYGIRLEYLRAAFRLAYSLLDKTAYFLNDYLNLGIREDRVNFRTLWYLNNEQRRGLRHDLERRENLPLRALYWLAKDLAPHEHAIGTLNPDAQHLALIRNHLEHKFLKLHTEGFQGPTPTHATGDLADTLPLHLHAHTFQNKCLQLLRLTRAAIIYLSLSIHREERERAKTRPPDQRVARINLYPLPEHRRQ